MVLEPWSWSAAGVLYRCGEIVAYGPSANRFDRDELSADLPLSPEAPKKSP
jgi:hypothetical protein